MVSPPLVRDDCGTNYLMTRTCIILMFLHFLQISEHSGENSKLVAAATTEDDIHPEKTLDGLDAAASDHDYNNDDVDGETNPREVQKAVCTVTAGEVKASAEAVTTKTLKGVCGSAEMNLALKNLETKFIHELEQIKSLLRQQFNTKANEDESTGGASDNQESTTATLFKSTMGSDKKSSHHFLKSLAPEENTPSTVSREVEIKKFNNTMLSDEDVKIFTYYWKLENFTQSVRDNGSIAESPIFSIRGKPFRIRASFNHMHRDYLHLQLEYASFDKRKDNFKNNIFLDMGIGGDKLFKEINDHQSSIKHKISILDKKNRSNDLVSQEFDNLKNGFLVPISALKSYAKNNSLLIQIIFYL